MENEKLFMNPMTGSVDTLENWQAEFAADKELWGSATWDAWLIAVRPTDESEKEEHGDWIAL
jgi:hypothetical protein